MDLSNLSAKVKGFQRRTTQKVLQQMGMADKTEDDTHIQAFIVRVTTLNHLKPRQACITHTDLRCQRTLTHTAPQHSIEIVERELINPHQHFKTS
jgi:hypothetical protein